MILEKIIEKKKEDIKRKKAFPLPVASLEKRDFKETISKKKISLIAEIKYVSPSLGKIKPSHPVEFLAKLYENNGASAISVVCEKDFFEGDIRFLKSAKIASSLPILRKDFIIDPWQIEESIAYGADAILLIASCLNFNLLAELKKEAEKAKIPTIIEVHNEDELSFSLKIGGEIIGINNRDLNTFKTDINTTLRLKPLIPDDRIVISESGIKTRDDILLLEKIGIQGVLIGESLLTSRNIPQKMKELLGD
ncbi:MAG: indole-3-glycerol phosphate synthase TrpC [bacterium]